MARVKANTNSMEAPQSKDEAEKYVYDIGRLQRENELDNAAFNDAVENLRASYSEATEKRKLEIEAKTIGLEKWAQANRVDVFGKSKSIALEFGRLIFRKNPPKVKVSRTADVIERCKDIGQFYRVKYSIDKEAMLAEPEIASQIEGVKIIEGDEVFSVEPNEQELGGQSYAN